MNLSGGKVQLISKCLFGIFNSPKKWTKKFDSTTMVPQVELFSFIFWENWRHKKDKALERLLENNLSSALKKDISKLTGL